MEIQIFHHAKILLNLHPQKKFKKSPQIKPKSFQNIIITLLTTTLNFQHKPKISSFKNPRVKIDLLLLLLLLLLPSRGQIPLNYYILYNNESKHNILALVGKVNKAPSQQRGKGTTKRERERTQVRARSAKTQRGSKNHGGF